MDPPKFSSIIGIVNLIERKAVSKFRVNCCRHVLESISTGPPGSDWPTTFTRISIFLYFVLTSSKNSFTSSSFVMFTL